MSNLNELLLAVCDYYGVDIEKVKSRRQYGELVRARRVFCYLAKEHFYHPYTANSNTVQMGRLINRNHEMVLYHHERQKGFNAIYQGQRNETLEIMEKFTRGHYEPDISKRYCTSLGYLGLAYTFNLEVDC